MEDSGIELQLGVAAASVRLLIDAESPAAPIGGTASPMALS